MDEIKEHYGEIVRMVRSRVHSAGLYQYVDDIIQDCLETIINRYCQYDPTIAGFLTWCNYQIMGVMSKWLRPQDYLETRYLFVEEPYGGLRRAEELRPETKEIPEWFYTLWSMLDERERMAFRYMLEDAHYNYARVAGHLGVSKPTGKVVVESIRAKATRCIYEKGE